MADDQDYSPPSYEDDTDTATSKSRRRSRPKPSTPKPSGDDKQEPHKRPKKTKKPKEKHDPMDDLERLWKLGLSIDPVTGIAHPPLRIAAFNIQRFGKKKIGEKDISHVLVQILQRYDLILIQELRDRSDTALDRLVELCSRVDPDDPYTSIVSERLGRNSYKEQYAFMYRYHKIQLKDIYQYDDGHDNGKDVFQREPFAVRFTSPSTAIQDFAVIAIHTQPSEAVREIDGLVKVYDVTKAHWGLEDIIIAGDFNADEGYVHRDDWSKIALRNDRRFKWMIEDETDTTVGNTDRAYDRFVVAGKKLVKSIVKGSCGVFKFDEELGLDFEEAEEVSDHYPIEMKLTGKPNHNIQSQLQTSVSFTVHQKQPVHKKTPIRKIYRADSGTEESAYFTHVVNYDDSRMREVVAKREGAADVLEALKQFQQSFPDVILDGTVEMVKAYLESSTIMAAHVYGLDRQGWDDHDKFDITITASLMDPLLCQISVVRRMS